MSDDARELDDLIDWQDEPTRAPRRWPWAVLAFILGYLARGFVP